MSQDPRIEPVAKAIYADVNEGHSSDKGWDEVRSQWQASYRSNARAAVAAIDKAATITTVEELDALPEESVIRSVAFGVVRERMDSGWLATGPEDFEQSEDIAGREHRVIHWGNE